MERLTQSVPEQAPGLQQRFELLVQRVDMLAVSREWPDGIVVSMPATETVQASTIYIKKYVEEVTSPDRQPDVHVSARWVHGEGTADMIDTCLSGVQLELAATDPRKKYDRMDSLSLMEIILDTAEQQLQ